MTIRARKAAPPGGSRLSGRGSWKRAVRRNWDLYLLLLPVLAYFIIFKYVPMYGLTIAFKDYKSSLGILGSPWLSTESPQEFFKWFLRFFQSYKFWPVIKNTLILSISYMIIKFPMPIILALVMNEMSSLRFKKAVQTVTYAPHFVSTAVLVAMVFAFTSPSSGIVNKVIELFGGDPIYFMTEPGWFRPLYILSGVWQGMGWGSIIYMSALSGIDPGLYEAAALDGASRFQMLRKITFPCLLPTAIIVLILDCSDVMSVGFEKVFLMQTSMNLSVSEVISTYTYEIGIKQSYFSYSTAIGLFNSVINLILLLLVNKLAKKLSDTSLW